MNGSAIVLMLAAMVVIWGGLITSVITLRAHSNRNDSDPAAEI